MVAQRKNDAGNHATNSAGNVRREKRSRPSGQAVTPPGYGMLKLIPVDFASDVSAEHAPHTIVWDTIFDRDIADGAVDQRAEEKLGEGFGAFSIGVVPLVALGGGRPAIAIQAAVPFGSQIEIDVFLADRQMPQHQGVAMFKERGGSLSAPVTNCIAGG